MPGLPGWGSSEALKPFITVTSRASHLGGKGWTTGRAVCGGYKGGVPDRAALPLVLTGMWVLQGSPGRRKLIRG